MQSRNSFRRNKNILTTVLIIIAAAALGILMYVSEQRDAALTAKLKALNESYRQEQKELESSYLFTLETSKDWDISTDYYEQIIAPDELIKSAKLVSGYNRDAAVIYDLSECDIDFEKTVLLAFVIYAENGSAQITVDTGSDDGTYGTYYITTQKLAFYLPIHSDNLKIKLTSDFQNVHVCNAQILMSDTEIVSGMAYGQYNLEETEEYSLEVGNLISNAAAEDLLTDENYLYVLQKGEFVVYRQDNLSEKVGILSGLGHSRHMDFVDAETVVVTSRENGVFFISIRNPEQPVVISTYDALDLATGVEVAGDYVFICSRYWGVEILDISDVENPELCSVINTGNENIYCCYDEGYLYISNWNTKAVYVYDISDINNPKEVGTISTDGNPYGITIKDRCLIVATGHHSSSDHTYKTSAGYGAGHGMEIYDISDPEDVSWLSTVKTDGRLYYAGTDSWCVDVCGAYVFLSSTYSGVYVYNIENPSNPIRIATIKSEISTVDSGEAIAAASYSKYIFPYNVKEYVLECINGISFSDGLVYLAGQTKGVYVLEMDILEFFDASVDNGAELNSNDGSFFNLISVGDIHNFEYTVYDGFGTVNAVDLYEDMIVLACGDKGVLIIDNNGNVLQTINTAGAAKDVLVYGDRMFVAEGNYGLEVYDLRMYSLVDYFTCNLKFETMSQLSISDDGKYIVVQDGWTRIRLLKYTNDELTEVDALTPGGTLYYRNLINQNADESILGFESSTKFVLYNVSNGVLEETISLDNSIYGENNGMCGYEGNIIAIYKNGYVVIDPDDLDKGTDLSTLDYYYLGDAYKLKGKVSCYDGLMVVTDSVNRNVMIVNIENIENPTILEYFSVDGSLDVSEITEKYIYIPLKYQGLLVLKR